MNYFEFLKVNVNFADHRITESQNHGIVGVGRDLCGLCPLRLVLSLGTTEKSLAPSS